MPPIAGFGHLPSFFIAGTQLPLDVIAQAEVVWGASQPS